MNNLSEILDFFKLNSRMRSAVFSMTLDMPILYLLFYISSQRFVGEQFVIQLILSSATSIVFHLTAMMAVRIYQAIVKVRYKTYHLIFFLPCFLLPIFFISAKVVGVDYTLRQFAKVSMLVFGLFYGGFIVCGFCARLLFHVIRQGAEHTKESTAESTQDNEQ